MASDRARATVATRAALRHISQALADHSSGAHSRSLQAGPPPSSRSGEAFRSARAVLPASLLPAQVTHPGPAVIEEVSPGRLESPDFQTPDLIEPVVAYRSWRVVDDALRSVYLPVFWNEKEVRATCMSAESPDADAPRSAAPGHSAPDRGCTCGVYAYYEPDKSFPTVDYRGVVGIVSLWGTIELHEEGMRAEHARVEALALYSRWTTRQIDAVRRIAAELEVDLVDLDDIEDAARRYGRHITRELIPGAAREPETAR